MTQPVFDAHLHIIDPAHPLVANNGYLPDPFTVTDYQNRTTGLNIQGGAVVSGSFQAFDQGYLIDALHALGPTYVGVTQIPADTSDARILALHEAGVRAIRFNVVRGGSASPDDLDRLARRVHDLAGWHTELYVDARSLDGLEDRIAALPAASIDHLGMHEDGLPTLLRLVERGVKVKATGFRAHRPRSDRSDPRDHAGRPDRAHGRYRPALHTSPPPVPQRGFRDHPTGAGARTGGGRVLEQRRRLLPG